MELRRALTQVAEIRAHLARTETFRGYRSATVAFTGVVGIVTAIIQSIWLPRPFEQWDSYLALWIGAAVLNVTFVGIEIWPRAALALTSRGERRFSPSASLCRRWWWAAC